MTESLQLLLIERKKTDYMTVEEAIQFQSQERFNHGLKKYGTTLDRADLHPIEWAQHAKEEMMDGIRYLERLQRDMESQLFSET